VPFFFASGRLIGTVCGCTGTGSACDRSSCAAWREEHWRGARRYPSPIQKRFCRPRTSTSISIPNSSRSVEKRTVLVHCCARCCMLPKHRERTSLYLKAISLVLHVHRTFQLSMCIGRSDHDRCVKVGYGIPFQPACNSLAHQIRAETPLEVRRKILRKRRWHRMLFDLS
jgi:hypothetical protein